MNELIKIEQKEGIETVSARDLHAFLESGYRFSDWIKSRIEKYEFKENADYIKVSEKIDTSGGSQLSIEYHISLDMAKELSMVENNEKGREARQYFIAREKQAKEFSMNLNMIAEMAAEIVVKKLDKKLNLSAPKKPKRQIALSEPEPQIISEQRDELQTCIVLWKGERFIVSKCHNDIYHWQVSAETKGNKYVRPYKDNFVSRRDALLFIKRRMGKDI